MPADATIRRLAADDGAAVNEAFNAVFGAGRTVEEWRWKFLGAGRAPRACIALDSGGGVLGQYAGLPVAMQVGGETVTAAQIVDVLVRSEGRRGLGAVRLFRRLVTGFVERFCGPEGVALTYGFPGPRHGRLVDLGAGALGDDAMPPFPVRLWRRGHGRRGAWITRHEVAGGWSETMQDALWARASARYDVAMVRDAAWARWRYGRPGAVYEFLWAVRRGRPAAQAVLRRTGDTLQVVDLVWDGWHEGALGALDRAVGRRVRACGAAAAELWVEGDPAAERVLSGLGWTAAPDPRGVRCMAYGFHPGFAAATLAARFFVTMADSDLV